MRIIGKIASAHAVIEIQIGQEVSPLREFDWRCLADVTNLGITELAKWTGIGERESQAGCNNPAAMSEGLISQKRRDSTQRGTSAMAHLAAAAHLQSVAF